MARIRTLKPEFWTDTKVVRLPPLARLMFQGIWNFADDAGVIENDPFQLKLQILPADDCDPAELVRHLVDVGLVVEAVAEDGCEVLVVRNWKHQKISNPGKPRHGNPDLFDYSDGGPSPRALRVVDPESSVKARESSSSPREDCPAEGKGGERKGVESARKRATQLPDGWEPNEAHRALAAQERVNCDREAGKFRDHAAAQGRTAKDWDAAFRNWIKRAADFGAKTTTQRDDAQQVIV